MADDETRRPDPLDALAAGVAALAPRRRPRRGARDAAWAPLPPPSARRARRSASRIRTGPTPSSTFTVGLDEAGPEPRSSRAVAAPDHPLTAAARDRAETSPRHADRVSR